MMKRSFSAPGKLVIAGEYAVLHGHEALAVSVNRHATITLSPALSMTCNNEVINCVLLEFKSRRIPLSPCAIAIDTSSLHLGSSPISPKLGLGSSAAIVVALTKALLSQPKEEAPEALQLEIALGAHKRFTSGLGSGIDIATSFFGGAIRFKTGTRFTPEISKCALSLDATSLITVYTGRSQSTNIFLKRVASAAQSCQSQYERAILGIAMATRGIINNMTHSESANFVNLCSAVKEHNVAMKALGSLAGVDIISDAHSQIAEIAERYNGAAKPSGAGGGDIALCFIPTINRNEFLREISAKRFVKLDLNFCDQGVK